MAREDIRLEVIGDVESYATAVGEIPGITQKAANKAAKAFIKAQERMAIKAVLEQKKAAIDAAENWEEEQAKAAAAIIAEQEKAAKESREAWIAEGKTAAKGFAAGFGAVAAGVAGIAAFQEQLAEVRREVTQLSDATDINIETLAGIRTATNAAGIEFDQAAGGLEDFGEKMFDASRGAGAALEAFELLGFTQEELQARLGDVDGVLREVIQGMQETEDGAIKNTLQQQLWGDAGNRLAAALGDIPLDVFIAEAEKSGLFAEENIRQSELWTQSLALLKEEIFTAAAELSDMFALGTGLEKFSAGFVFMKDTVSAVMDELVDNVSKPFQAMAAFAQGDVIGAGKLVADFLDVRDSAATVFNEIADGTQDFRDLREATRGVGDETQKTARDLADLSEVQEEAAKEAAARAKEEEQAAKEKAAAGKAAAKAAADLGKQQQKLADRQEAAAESLADITDQLTEDRLTAEQSIQRERDRTLEQIGEIEAGLADLVRAGVDVAEEITAAEEAKSIAIASAEADLEVLRIEGHLAQLERQRVLDELRAESAETQREREEEDAEARAERTQETVDAIMQGAESALDILGDLSAAQEAAAKDALDQQTDANDTLREERAALKEELLGDISETERAELESQINRLDGELKSGKKAAKARREGVLASFRASRALALTEIGISTAAAFMQALAQLGPTPAGYIAAGAAVVSGGIQAGLVLAESPPQFHDGFTGAGTAAFTRGTPDEQLVSQLEGESTLNRRATDAVGPQAIDALNRGAAGMGGGEMGLFLDGRSAGALTVRGLTSSSGRRQVRRISGTRSSGQVAVFRR